MYQLLLLFYCKKLRNGGFTSSHWERCTCFFLLMTLYVVSILGSLIVSSCVVMCVPGNAGDISTWSKMKHAGELVNYVMSGFRRLSGGII